MRRIVPWYLCGSVMLLIREIYAKSIPTDTKRRRPEEDSLDLLKHLQTASMTVVMALSGK